MKYSFRILCALTLGMSGLLTLPVAHAQTGATSANPPGAVPVPALAPAKPVTLPKIVDKTLPNGLRLVILEDHSRPAVAARLAIPAGSIRDAKAKVGTAALVADLLTKGTVTRSESVIADTIDGLGASIGASSGADYLSISAGGLSAFTDTILDLLADVTLRPTFPDKELERTRTQAIAGYQSALASAGTVADAALARLTYGEHPYGNFSSGTPQTLQAITRDDLQAFHRSYFVPNGAVLFIAGDIKPDKAEQKARELFGNWAAKPLPALPPVPAKTTNASGKPRIVVINRPDAAQTEVRIGTLTTGYNDPQRIPANVANSILGGGSFENRLQREIRVKRGLTYGAGSGFDRNKEAGLFTVNTFTKNESTGEVLRVINEEVDKLRQTPVGVEELAERKTFLTGSFAVQVATPEGVLARLSSAILYGGGPQEVSEYVQKVQAVQSGEVQTTFTNLQPAQMTIVLVGDAKAIRPQVASLGDVTVLDQSNLDFQSVTLQGAQTSAPVASANAPNLTEAERTQGRALLDATVKAHGGEKLLAVKSITLKGKGKLTTPPSQGNIELPVDSLTVVAAVPNKSRLQMQTGFGEIIAANPGGGQPGWLSFGGQVQSGGAAEGLSGGLDPATLLVQAVQGNYPVAPLANGDTPAPTSDGKKLSGFRIFTPNGKATRVYVEDGTGLVRRIETDAPAQGPNPGGTVQLNLGNYKDTSGVQIPFALTLRAGGQEFLNLTFTSADVNSPTPDTLFEKPKN